MEWFPGIDTIGRQLITSILAAIATGVAAWIVRAIFSDALDFLLPRLTDIGYGRANTIYLHTGKQYFGEELREISLPEELRNDKNDAHVYEFVDVELKINRSYQVRLRATMKYKEGGRSREAKVWGRGEYIRQEAGIKDGLAAISCRFAEEGTKDEWTATYFLRATSDGLWKGYWFLLDQRNWNTTNFGIIEFNTEQKQWLLARLFRSTKPKEAGAGGPSPAPASGG